MSATIDFVAIDVETANANMASICQVGLAAFALGELVDEWVSLVDPEDFFAYPNMCVHGIRPEDVAGAPTLPDVFEAIASRLDGGIAVCHTHFDRVAVHQACHKYGLPQPECVWLDSARIARRTWSEFASRGYGLQNVCDRIGYDFTGHDALEDAKAAGRVVLAASAETGLSIQDWLYRVEQPIDPVVSTSKRVSRQGNPDGRLFGEVVVFTGTLAIPRREAADLVEALGCAISESVSKKTTMLVVGDQDVAKLAGHDKSSKHRKAEDLIEQGHQIRILRESDLLELAALASDDSSAAPSLKGMAAPYVTRRTDDQQPRPTVRSRSSRDGLVATIGVATGDDWDEDDWDEDDGEVYYGDGVEQDLGEASDLVETQGFEAAKERLLRAEASYDDPVSLHAIYEALIELCLRKLDAGVECGASLADYVTRDLDLLERHLAPITDEERRRRIGYAETRPEPYRSELLAEASREPFALSVWALTSAAIHYARVGDYDSAVGISRRAAALGLDDGTQGGFAGRTIRLEKKLLSR